MRSSIFRFAAALVMAGLPGVLAAQELTLPRKELDDAIKAAKDARIQELTAEQRKVQKAIGSGGKGFGDNRRDAIINARKRLAEVEAELADAKKAAPTPELDIDELAVGQLGTLYRLVVPATPRHSAGSNPALTQGSAAAFSASLRRPAAYHAPVEIRIIEIIDAGAAIATYGNKALWLRTATAGLTTGQKMTLD